MSLAFRPARIEDAEPCGHICYEAFRSIAARHGFPPDFPAPETAVGLFSFLIPRPDIYCVVAELDGRVVGSNVLWETSTIGGVGPITVMPTDQNRAVGRQLMEEVLDRAHQQRLAGVRLVQAAYHSRSLALYTKLGFDVVEPLAVLQGSPPGLTIPGCAVRPATEADIPPCEQLYREIHGHTRTTELRIGIAQGTARVVERAGRVTGYTTGIGFFGYVVGEGNEDVMALIGAAPAILGSGLLLPMRNSELFRWCLTQGLHIVQTMTLMSRGEYQEPLGAFLPSVIY